MTRSRLAAFDPIPEVLNDDEELGRCQACGGWLDPTGRPVGDGDSLQVIRLTEKPAYWQAQARA